MSIDLPPRALAIWRARPDLQPLFDPETPPGREALARWYFLEGYREMGLKPDPAFDEAAAANHTVTELPALSGTPITWLMRELWAREQARRHANRAARLPAAIARLVRRVSRRRNSLKTRGGQARMLPWYFTHGLADARLYPLVTPDQVEFLRTPSAANPALPRLLEWIRIDDPSLGTREEVLEWAKTVRSRKWPILAVAGLAGDKAPAKASAGALKHPFGVNVIGHARGRSGISEDVRMAAASLEKAGIPYAIHDLNSAENLLAEDQSVSHLIRNDLPYAFNLFCVTGMDTVTAVARGTPDFREGRYTIGFWPWELPEWPPLWAHAYEFIDEVWASSKFTFQSHARLSTVPVRHMPMAVSTAESDGLSRSDLCIPGELFLFSFAFDGLSSFARKNPAAVIAAFQQAFPDRREAVALLLKGLRVEGHPAWEQMRSAADQDPRIILFDQSVSRGALLDLHRISDCFVSLHRAEGFGRNIAECMSLGKPVISTAFSGNMDFTLPDTAALVPFVLRDIAVGEYPFAEGQQWADPDVGSAAQLMRRIVSDPEWRQAIAAAGKDKIHRDYSAEAVGAAYRPAFEEIWQSRQDVALR